MLKLIISLGNPGEKLALSRHNFGFMTLDKLAQNHEQRFIFDKKFNALINQIKFGDRNIILAKPQTMMNNSGQAAAKISRYWQIKPEEILVVHDDNDIPFGQIKLVFNRNSAGHRGVDSIIDHLKTQAFFRLRLGILPETPSELSLEDFVLQPFGQTEQTEISPIIKKTGQIIWSAIEWTGRNPEDLLKLNLISQDTE